MSGLLDGVRVLDASRWLAGAEATSILADLGADVIVAQGAEAGGHGGRRENRSSRS